MKNFAYNLNRLAGDETDEGFQRVISRGGKPDVIIPVVLEDDDENVPLPKIVVRPFISYLPVSRAITPDGKTFSTTHTGAVQIDHFSTDGELLIDMVQSTSDRLIEFFTQLELLHFIDPYEWEVYQTIKVNDNYDSSRNIIRYGDYEKMETLETCISTQESWFLDDTGLYVNGDIDLEMYELINGRVFPEGLTAQEAGFMSIIDKTALKRVRGSEPEDHMFTLRYEIVYVSFRDRAEGGIIDQVNVTVDRND